MWLSAGRPPRMCAPWTCEVRAVKYVLFDLDGTLLPMDQDKFVNGYFGVLAKKLAPHGYEPEKLIRSIWGGTAAMVNNDGAETNEAVFWDYFTGVYGERVRADIPVFEEFYAVEFQQARSLCGYTPRAAETVALVCALGAVPVLATNPLFPDIATRSRIGWAGLTPEDFALYTTYENISWCKPNLDYYREVLRRAGLDAPDCLMVGNDVGEDMVAQRLGMQVFLLTDCMINKDNADISAWPHGGFEALMEYLEISG